MPWDDIVYVSLLLFCIGFGHVYRKIRDAETRQWASTIIGLTVVTIVSGGHVAHPVLCTLINALIITQLSWKICHLVSFGFTFFYLLGFFRLADWYGLPDPPAHTNLVQMMLTLKLVGLAFEINSAATASPDDPLSANSPAMKKVGFLDVIHYGFSYMGVLTGPYYHYRTYWDSLHRPINAKIHIRKLYRWLKGPYYRYRTYWDSLHRPFADQVDHWGITFAKLQQIAVFIVLHLLSGYLFPGKYALTEEFFERSFLYRFIYVYPTFFTFKMRIYTGMALSECVCSMAGLGAYPTSCETISGLGPKNYKAMESLSQDPEKAKKEALDFETVHNINVWGVETCISVRTAMKMWNTCIQYWMATCVYKRFPHKGLRTVFTFALSALWHGYYVGYYICICSLIFYLPMEDIYMKFYNQSEENSIARKGWGFFLWFMKTLCMSYLGFSFQLLRSEESFAYYGSIFYAGHVLVAILYVAGRLLKPYIIVKPKIKEG